MQLYIQHAAWQNTTVRAVVVTVAVNNAGVPETDVKGGFAGGGEWQ